MTVTTAPIPPTEPEYLAAALAQLDRMQGLFGRVEGKASFLMAVDLALLGSVAVSLPVAAPVSPGGVVGVVAASLLGFSLINLYACFYPHLKNPRPSILYFADIAALGADAYRRRLRQTQAADLADDALCQVWRNAEILDKKFKRSRSAFLLTATALPFWLATLALATARSGSIPGLG
jgi:hypothetical protein